MFRSVLLTLSVSTLLAASTPSPISMANDLNLSTNQIKQLQRIDATLEQVKRISQAKQIEVLTPAQRKTYLSRYKNQCNTN